MPVACCDDTAIDQKTRNTKCCSPPPKLTLALLGLTAYAIVPAVPAELESRQITVWDNCYVAKKGSGCSYNNFKSMTCSKNAWDVVSRDTNPVPLSRCILNTLVLSLFLTAWRKACLQRCHLGPSPTLRTIPATAMANRCLNARLSKFLRALLSRENLIESLAETE